MHIKLYVRTELLKGISSITISTDRETEAATGKILDASIGLITALKGEEKAKAKRITPAQIVALYNEYAEKNKWVKVRVIGEALKRTLSIAAKELPEASQWELVLNGLRMDSFFSGSSSDYKTSIETLTRKSRYIEFYNKALESQDRPLSRIEEITTQFDKILAEIPSLPVRPQE